MKLSFSFILVFSVLSLLNTSSFAATAPRDEDELLYVPKGSQFIPQKDIPIPTGIKKIFFQGGRITADGAQIDGNARYCFMLLKMPSSRERVLEKDVAVVTSGTYRTATSVIELEVAQPIGIFDLGCVSSPKETAKATIGQFKKEVEGIFELVFPGPDPIR